MKMHALLQRRFARSPVPFTSCNAGNVLHAFSRPDFIVIFEGYAVRAVNLIAFQKAKSGLSRLIFSKPVD